MAATLGPDLVDFSDAADDFAGAVVTIVVAAITELGN